MAPSNKVDPKRLEQLKQRIHHKALTQMLSKNPHIIEERDIESHSGRLSKAIRVLVGARHIYQVCPVMAEDNTYGGYGRKRRIYGYWTETLDVNIDTYASEATERHFEGALRDDLEVFMKKGYEETSNLSFAGWRTFNDMSLPVLAFVWLHKEEYLFMEEKNRTRNWLADTPDRKPVPWDECEKPVWFAKKDEFSIQPKLIMRNYAEMYARDNFPKLSKRDTTLKGCSHRSEIEVSLPNIGGVPFLKTNLEKADVLCEEALAAITMYRKGCRAFKDAVESYGGEDGYRREIMRRATIDMLDLAPVILAEANGVPNGKTIMAKYLLGHANMIDHDSLFDDRDSVMTMRSEDSDYSRYTYFGVSDSSLGSVFKEVLGLEKKEDDLEDDM